MERKAPFVFFSTEFLCNIVMAAFAWCRGDDSPALPLGLGKEKHRDWSHKQKGDWETLSPGTDSPQVLHPTHFLPSHLPLLLGCCSRREGEKAGFGVQAHLHSMLAILQPARSRAGASQGLNMPCKGWQGSCASSSTRGCSGTPGPGCRVQWWSQLQCHRTAVPPGPRQPREQEPSLKGSKHLPASLVVFIWGGKA